MGTRNYKKTDRYKRISSEIEKKNIAKVELQKAEERRENQRTITHYKSNYKKAFHQFLLDSNIEFAKKYPRIKAINVLHFNTKYNLVENDFNYVLDLLNYTLGLKFTYTYLNEMVDKRQLFCMKITFENDALRELFMLFLNEVRYKNQKVNNSKTKLHVISLYRGKR